RACVAAIVPRASLCGERLQNHVTIAIHSDGPVADHPASLSPQRSSALTALIVVGTRVVCMRAPLVRLLLQLVVGLCTSVTPAYSQDQQTQTRSGETLSGPDSHETEPAQRGRLLGDWRGTRSRLLQRGVQVDVHYVSDSLGNIDSDRSGKFFG